MDIFRFKKHTNFNYCCEFRKFKQMPDINITKHNILILQHLTLVTFRMLYILFFFLNIF